MKLNSEEIRNKINELKTVLNLLLDIKEPTDDEVVEYSQKLDEFIVKYQRIECSSKYLA